MPVPVPTAFTEWEFTQKEAYAATRFSELNLMLIQSLIANAAQRRLNIKFNPMNPTLFAQEEAELQGEIGAYQHLLMLATETEVPEAQYEQEKAVIIAAAKVSQPPSQPL